MIKKGFTLIELLVVITVIGTLSIAGVVYFGGTQDNARDSVRKHDLKELSLSLELYYQRNGRYPCIANTPFPEGANYSNKTGFWITDTPSCGNKPLGIDFIKDTPLDPLNTNPTSVISSTSSFGLGYWSGNGGQCYMLFTRLEDGSDPDRHELKGYQGCDGNLIVPITNSNYKNLYFITSENR